ncbi:MAG: ABC transporter permease [Nannocystaceae bacterium]|nr:ABC transporter permease [Nannocystaceae bacterium]
MRNLKLLTRDELLGFAKSKVMLVLWIGLPVLALLVFVLPILLGQESADSGRSMAALVALLVSSLAGTVSAIMVAVDIGSERKSGVYQLLVIRPLPRDAILWAKYIAVFTCVTLACVVALATGVFVDLIRGTPLPAEAWNHLARSLLSTAGVIAISTAIGVFVGSVTTSTLVAVIVVLYAGQNLAVIPMIPNYFGLEEYFWPFMGGTVVLALGVMFAATLLFRRVEL